MSKVVILSVQLGAPQIVEDLLKKISVRNPSMAEWIRQFDAAPIIKECLGNALDRLGRMDGIQKGATVTDYYNKAYGGKLDGILKTNNLPKGLGFRVAGNGAVEFVADDYTSEWKKEIKRLRELFTDAFMAEITASILQILGYDVKIQSAPLENGGFSYNLEGVRP